MSGQASPNLSRQPTTRHWFVIHIIFPLLPFILGSIVRFVTYSVLTWNTCNASELSLSVALILFFVQQDLLGYEIILNNRDKEEERMGASVQCFVFAVVLVVFFALIEAFNSLINDHKLHHFTASLHAMETIVFIVSMYAIYFAIRVQRGFKLTAKLI